MWVLVLLLLVLLVLVRLLFDQDIDKYIYGIVNLAAFLANAMVESIHDDTCDELNWQAVAGH